MGCYPSSASRVSDDCPYASGGNTYSPRYVPPRSRSQNNPYRAGERARRTQHVSRRQYDMDIQAYGGGYNPSTARGYRTMGGRGARAEDHGWNAPMDVGGYEGGAGWYR
ncbi:hypothetical protein LTR10_006502 [Elasticomyces elasticus]|nr:hypothetical protein LTR10_006502 [Elasticomyces elasticus]